MTDVVHVAVGVLRDEQGRVLLTRRHENTHQGGLWEFPGGKVEPAESVVDALSRELREELSIDVVSHSPLISIKHHYDDRTVLLDVHCIEHWQGEARGMEQQPLVWCKLDALSDYPMPEADVPIVTALSLPSIYVITPPESSGNDRFPGSLQQVLEQGRRLIQFRLFGTSAEQQQQLVQSAQALCADYGANLLLNADVDLARRVGVGGLHLNSRQLRELTERPEGFELVAASCHSADDLARATALNADFAVLSPVLPTRSHPDAEPLGWDRFSRLVADAVLPVYALGGMQPEHLATAREHGAQGIAGIRGLWPDETV